MGKAKTPKTNNINMRLDEIVIHEIVAVAEKEGEMTSSTARMLLMMGLEAYKEKMNTANEPTIAERISAKMSSTLGFPLSIDDWGAQEIVNVLISEMDVEKILLRHKRA